MKKDLKPSHMKKTIVSLLILALIAGGGFAIYSYIVANNEIISDEASPLDSTPLTNQEDEENIENETATNDETTNNEQEKISRGPMFEEMTDHLEEMEKEDFMEETEKMINEEMEKEEEMPAGPQLIAQGDFIAAAHEVEGEALLIEGEETIIRFENFESINGPNLHIYLATDIEATDYIDLGEIKATKGNVNYSVPAETDLEKYNHVLVWCVPFAVNFSYAKLENL